MAGGECLSVNGNSANAPSVEEAPQLLEGGGKLEVDYFICYKYILWTQWFFFSFSETNFQTGYKIYIIL